MEKPNNPYAESDNNPTPIRLGKMKASLMKWVAEENIKSLHCLIQTIIRQRLIKEKRMKKKEFFTKWD